MEINWKLMGVIFTIVLIGILAYVIFFYKDAPVSKVRQLNPGTSLILIR